MWNRDESSATGDDLSEFFSEDIDNLFTSAIALVVKYGNAIMISCNRKRDAVLMRFYEDGSEPESVWCNDAAAFRDALIELHAYHSLQNPPKSL